MALSSYYIDQNRGQKNAEDNRAQRLQNITSELKNEDTARQMSAAQGVDQAYRNSYTEAQQPAAPSDLSQDPTGAQNLTTGQTQVQTIPTVSDTPKAPASPIASMQLPAPTPVPASAIAPPAPRDAAFMPPAPATPRAAPIPPPPPATALPSAGGQQPAPSSPAPSLPAPPQSSPAQLPQATAFDSPQFQQNLAAHLAQVPGAGQELMKIKAQRDATISSVMQMIAQGDTDEARYTAQRNGLNIPEQFYQNSDLAAGMNYASKAYPEDPDKGQKFYSAFTQTQGTLQDRVSAGMQAAGAPTSLGQKELYKAMALGRGNYLTAGGGLSFANPISGTITPYKSPSGQDVTGITAGYGLHGATGAAGKRFMNVGGQLIDTQNVDAQGRPTIVVPKNQDRNTAIVNLTNHILAAGGPRMKSADAAKQATDIVDGLKSGALPDAGTPASGAGAAPAPANGAGSTPLNGQKLPDAAPAPAIIGPAPDTYENMYGTSPGAASGSLGTQTNPIVPQEQSDIDNAPPGSFINVGDTLYQK